MEGRGIGIRCKCGGIVIMLHNRIRRSSSQGVVLVESVEVTTRTVTMPSDILPGDLAILIAFGRTNPTVSVTSGFTQQTFDTTVFDTNYEYILATRILDGTEGGDSIQGFSISGSANYTTLLIFRKPGAVSAVGTGFAGEDYGDSTGQSISYPIHTQDLPFIGVIAAAVSYDSTPTRTVSISNSILTPIFTREEDETAIKIFVENTEYDEPRTMASAVTDSAYYNFLNITTLLPE